MAAELKTSNTPKWVQGLSNEIALCESIGKTLDQLGEPLVTKGVFKRSSDFQRARARVVRTSKDGRVGIRYRWPGVLGPDLIHVDIELKRIGQCCRRCPKRNALRQANGQKFECVVRLLDAQTTKGEFRFQLDRKGQIVEK